MGEAEVRIKPMQTILATNTGYYRNEVERDWGYSQQEARHSLCR